MLNQRHALTILLAFCAASCGGINEDQARVLQGESGLSRSAVRAGDPEMDAAMAEARASLPEFLRAFRLASPDHAGFAVKKEYRRNQYVEYIWITDLKINGSVFEGTSGNDSEDTVGVRFGDPARVTFDEVCDWMYTDNGVLVGGRTVRVVYSRMNGEQKAQFQKEAPFRIQ